MNKKQEKALRAFADEYGFLKQKGALCVALVGTRKAKEKGLPLDPESMKTPRKGQVSGLSKGAVQNILKDYGIHRILAKEGGRTSRGSLDNMNRYLHFLNKAHAKSPLQLEAVERFWIDRVIEYFAGKPFKLKLDRSAAISTIIRDLLEQAVKRQKEYGGGTQYLGAMMQHLTGAKLIVISQTLIKQHSFSTSDQQHGRHGDFEIGDAVVHVTSSPTEALIKVCKSNLDQGKSPIIVSLARKIEVAEELAEQQSLKGRIDVFGIEQFMAANIYEIGKFRMEGHQSAIVKLLEVYNDIIEEVETDPSLKIEY